MLHQTESGLSIIFNIQLNDDDDNNNNKRKTKKDNKAAFGNFAWNNRTCPVPEDWIEKVTSALRISYALTKTKKKYYYSEREEIIISMLQEYLWPQFRIGGSL